MPQAHYQSPPPQTPQHQYQYYSPPPSQPKQQSRQQCQLPSERMATMYSSAQIQSQDSIQARRRQEREELKRLQITSFRKDGLLSPPPLPAFARRKKKSISGRDIGANGRAMESSPELTSPSDNEEDESDSTCSSGTPFTPPPYSRKYAASTADLHVYTADPESFSFSVGLGITSPGPKSAPVLRGMNNSPRRPSPFRSRTLDEALLGASMIQPPSPSLLRPKSFWKNHPRSALTSLAYSPCSQVVRRSTFVAAGMNIDQGFWESFPTETPELERPPCLPPKDETTSRRSSQDSESTDSQDTDSEPDTHTHTHGYGIGTKEQYDPIRAFGRSLWNASTLALAVESRNRGGMGGLGGMPGIVCVPGDY